MSAGPGDLPAHIRARGDRDASDREITYPAAPNPLSVGVYDNHAHLEFADGDNPMDYTEHLDRAGAVGVLGVIQVGTDVETSQWSSALAHREPRVLAAVAIHPNEAPLLHQSGELEDALAVIDELAAKPRVVAVGRRGLISFAPRQSFRVLKKTPFVPTSRSPRSTIWLCKSMTGMPTMLWWTLFSRWALPRRRSSTASAVMRH